MRQRERERDFKDGGQKDKKKCRKKYRNEYNYKKSNKLKINVQLKNMFC